ncbi:MAG: nucleoside deaminase [Acidiferrobacterales bacterium]
MPLGDATDTDHKFMGLALQEAKTGYDEGGVPVGAVMVEDGEIIGRGRNRRVQEGNPVSHGETDCMKNAGRRSDYARVTMYTTLSPCMMCTGTILQFGIQRVVIGEDRNFSGNIDFLNERGVEVVLLNDRDCIELMSKFVAERPELWYEDISGNE